MNKIVNIPLDERPCTYDFPQMIASMSKDIEVVTAPRTILGQKKIPGDTTKIYDFILNECKDATFLVLALDTLLYGGIVPSRLHYSKEEDLLKLLNVLKEVKKVNNNIKIFAYHLIMRCPSYSGNDEEPDYYEYCGREIHLIGKYRHISSIRTLNEEEKALFDKCNKFVKDNDYGKYVDDYLARRVINTDMNNHSIDLVKEGIIDFLVIPQDDSAPYGFTAIDQIKVRNHIEKLGLQNKVLMYPDADAVSNALLARAINDTNNVKPNVYVRYSTCNNGNIIPNYEDRPISESLKYQIMAAGGRYVSESALADITLLVNLPLANMLEARHLYDSINDKNNPGEKNLNYTVGRNLVEFVEYAEYLINSNKCVGLADVAYANGGDTVLFNMLKDKKILFKLDGYAGWNTAANTIGTCLPLTMVTKIYGKSEKLNDFLALRYLEDVGYQSNVRFKVYDKYKSKGWGYMDESINKEIEDELVNWLNINLQDELKVELVSHYQPWHRFFETSVICKTYAKEK